MERKLGLVLSGGGGNGAYQAGVWKYLAEAGIARQVRVISGTSVGALNAVLFTSTSVEAAERMWTQGIEGKILLPQESTGNALGETLSALTGGCTDAGDILKPLARTAGKGIWARAGLERIIREMDLSQLSAAPPVYATCFAVSPFLGTRHFRLNHLAPDTVRKVLLATSAIPLAFRPESVGGILYYDGGLGCSVPVEPLVRERCTDVLAVCLSEKHRLPAGLPPSMRVMEIRPSARLGRLGVLNFSCGHTERLIRMGYDDCRRLFGSMDAKDGRHSIV